MPDQRKSGREGAGIVQIQATDLDAKARGAPIPADLTRMFLEFVKDRAMKLYMLRDWVAAQTRLIARSIARGRWQ